MIYAILVALGLCMGSFIEALTWRLHKQSTQKRPDKKLSIVNGRSMCVHCNHELGFWDLIPLVSWLSLAGKCRYCKGNIGWQAPALEVAMAGLFVLSYWQWPYDTSLAGAVALTTWLASLVVLVALCVYDLRWMILPDKLVVILTGLSIVLCGAISVATSDPRYVLNPALGAIFLSGLFWALFQVSGGKWIGGGDVKIAISLGLIAGSLVDAIVLLFIASLLGTLVSIPLLLRGQKMSTKLPFGPFLITATIIVFLWGDTFINWYRQIIGV